MSYRPSGGARTVSLFSSQASIILTGKIKLLGNSRNTPSSNEVFGDDNSVRIDVSGTDVDDGERKSGNSECNSCHVIFHSRAEQVGHYRLDWHRYNLKRRLRGFPHVTQIQFEEEAGELSSISGSESDTDDDTEKTEKATPTDSTHQSNSTPFVYFTAENGTVCSVYKVILTRGKEVDDEVIGNLSICSTWIILMRAGDHFAGAVYRGSELVAHKTFHRYTVRAKRGTSQSVRDNQSGGHGPKSAGASLRRYNELAMEREVQALLQSWTDHFTTATAIFLRAPKSRQSMFTGGRAPAMSRDDPRLRGIPFPTRRPTLKEIKRVHSCLASLYLHGNTSKKSVGMETVPVETSVDIKGGEELVTVKEREFEEEEEKRNIVHGAAEVDEREGEEGSDEDSGMNDELRDNGKLGRKKKRRRKKKKTEKQWREISLPPALAQLLSVCERGMKEDEEEGEEEEDELLSLLQSLNISSIHPSIETTPTNNEENQPAKSSETLNTLYGGMTPLHIASEHGHHQLVKLLLEHGADPTIKDSGGRVPYVVTKEKLVRDCYRRFMGQWPETYDYTAAQIPSPLTVEMEKEKKEKAAEKRREKKRQAKKKKEEEKVKKEEEEMTRRQGQAVQGLSEREKRVMAAERRLALQNSNDSAIQKAGVCNCCGRGLAGLIPFHRLQYHYCSILCVREHRTKLES